eukprot:CAMPEP_0177784696 /NCGR_PEP_ID=MMETSP0491_2-20121128/19871_1 /TAXON_ID=63592 /ORGANISM="Tetraselmis chuii, Strain PLY429" /LENGTH=626 /DNA_ID=CAMNT_0019305545 /DNA_START=229 /DNA_END=2109 /DNA_ORIENTATION=+
MTSTEPPEPQTRESPANALFAAVDIEVAQQDRSAAGVAGAAAGRSFALKKSLAARPNEGPDNITSRAADSAAPTASGSLDDDTRSGEKLAPAFGDVPPRKRKRSAGDNDDEANSGGSDGEKVAKKVSDSAVEKVFQAMRAGWKAEKEAGEGVKTKESGITPLKKAGEEVITVSDSDAEVEPELALTAEQVAATPADKAREAWVKERASRMVAQESLQKNKKWIKQALVTLSNVRTRLYDLEGEISKQKAGRLDAQETNAKLARQAQRFRTQITQLETKVTEAKQLQQHCVKQLVGEQEASKSASLAWKEVKAQLAIEEQNRKKAVALLRNSERLLSLAYAKLGPEKVRELTKEAGTVNDSSPGNETENGSPAVRRTASPPVPPAAASKEEPREQKLMEELQQRLREERSARLKAEKDLEEEQMAHRMLRGAHKDAVNQLAKQADIIQALRQSTSRSQAGYGYGSEQYSPVSAMAQEESLRRRERLEMLHQSQGRSYGLLDEYAREREARLRSSSPRSATAEQVFKTYLAEQKAMGGGSSRGQKRGSIDGGHHDWDSVLPGRVPEDFGSLSGRHHSLHGLRDSLEDGLRRSAEAELMYGLGSRGSSGRLYSSSDLRDRREASKYADR